MPWKLLKDLIFRVRKLEASITKGVVEIRTAEVKLKLKKPNINSENPNSKIKNYLGKRLHEFHRRYILSKR